MEKVVVTGSAGALGQVLGLRLGSRYRLVGLDLNPSPGYPEQCRGDVRDGELVAQAMEGARAAVHLASLHGINLRTATSAEFITVNLLGTLNVLEAARRVGARVVYVSTISVFGRSGEPRAGKAVRLDESSSTEPTDIHALTKLLAEMLCEFFTRQHGVPTVRLRMSRFGYDDYGSLNVRKLFKAVDPDDAVQAIRLAIDRHDLIDETLCIAASPAYSERESAQLLNAAVDLVEERWPGAGDLLRAFSLSAPTSVTSWVSSEHARQRLGFAPARDFGTFLTELQLTKQNIQANTSDGAGHDDGLPPTREE